MNRKNSSSTVGKGSGEPACQKNDQVTDSLMTSFNIEEFKEREINNDFISGQYAIEQSIQTLRSVEARRIDLFSPQEEEAYIKKAAQENVLLKNIQLKEQLELDNRVCNFFKSGVHDFIHVLEAKMTFGPVDFCFEGILHSIKLLIHLDECEWSEINERKIITAMMNDKEMKDIGDKLVLNNKRMDEIHFYVQQANIKDWKFFVIHSNYKLLGGMMALKHLQGKQTGYDEMADKYPKPRARDHDLSVPNMLVGTIDQGLTQMMIRYRNVMMRGTANLTNKTNRHCVDQTSLWFPVYYQTSTSATGQVAIFTADRAGQENQNGIFLPVQYTGGVNYGYQLVPGQGISYQKTEMPSHLAVVNPDAFSMMQKAWSDTQPSSIINSSARYPMVGAFVPQFVAQALTMNDAKFLFSSEWNCFHLMRHWVAAAQQYYQWDLYSVFDHFQLQNNMSNVNQGGTSSSITWNTPLAQVQFLYTTLNNLYAIYAPNQPQPGLTANQMSQIQDNGIFVPKTIDTLRKFWMFAYAMCGVDTMSASINVSANIAGQTGNNTYGLQNATINFVPWLALLTPQNPVLKFVPLFIFQENQTFIPNAWTVWPANNNPNIVVPGFTYTKEEFADIIAVCISMCSNPKTIFDQVLAFSAGYYTQGPIPALNMISGLYNMNYFAQRQFYNMMNLQNLDQIMIRSCPHQFLSLAFSNMTITDQTDFIRGGTELWEEFSRGGLQELMFTSIFVNGYYMDRAWYYHKLVIPTGNFDTSFVSDMRNDSVVPGSFLLSRLANQIEDVGVVALTAINKSLVQAQNNILSVRSYAVLMNNAFCTIWPMDIIPNFVGIDEVFFQRGQAVLVSNANGSQNYVVKYDQNQKAVDFNAIREAWVSSVTAYGILENSGTTLGYQYGLNAPIYLSPIGFFKSSLPFFPDDQPQLNQYFIYNDASSYNFGVFDQVDFAFTPSLTAVGWLTQYSRSSPYYGQTWINAATTNKLMNAVQDKQQLYDYLKVDILGTANTKSSQLFLGASIKKDPSEYMDEQIQGNLGGNRRMLEYIEGARARGLENLHQINRNMQGPKNLEHQKDANLRGSKQEQNIPTKPLIAEKTKEEEQKRQEVINEIQREGGGNQ